MNLFNQNYHIQIHMCKLQLEKKKQNKIVECKKDSMERPLENIYIYIYIYISFKILIIDF